MSHIVGQAIHRAGRLTLIWSDGTASFAPYHIEAEELKALDETARSARTALAEALQNTEEPRHVNELTTLGHQLYRMIFRIDSTEPGSAHRVHDWLIAQNVTSLDIVGDAPGRIPWNLLCAKPSDAGLELCWGTRYALGVGRRVNPLWRDSMPENPRALVVVDDECHALLTTEQQGTISEWEKAGDANLVENLEGLERSLRAQAPSLMVIIARIERAGFWLGEHRVTGDYLRLLLAESDEGSPDPLVVICGMGDSGQVGTWECFLSGAVNGLAGVLTNEVPLPIRTSAAIGLALAGRLIRSEGGGVGATLQGLRSQHGLAGLAWSAFCPATFGGDESPLSDPDIFPLPESPYRPFEPFSAEDRALFIGREDDIVLCSSLIDEAATSVVLIHGPAASGKSSLVRAGIIPFLEQDSIGYRVLSAPEETGDVESSPLFIRPGIDFIRELAQALTQFCDTPLTHTTPTGDELALDLHETMRNVVAAAPKPTPAPANEAYSESPLSDDGRPTSSDDGGDALYYLLKQDPEALARVMDAITLALPYELVLVIEQAEEWLTLADSGAARRIRQSSLQMLSNLAQSPARCKVVMTIRTEFLGRLIGNLPAAKPSPRWRTFFLAELSDNALTQAVLTPTSRKALPNSDEIPRDVYNFSFGPGMAERLVSSARRGSADSGISRLVLLHSACTELRNLAIKRPEGIVSPKDLKARPVTDTPTRLLQRIIVSLKSDERSRQALHKLMDHLVDVDDSGASVRVLLDSQEVQRYWTGAPAKIDDTITKAAEYGLLDLQQLVVDGEEDLFVSLPNDSLAQVVRFQRAESEKKKYSGARVSDTLWIMIPLIFLVGALVFFLTNRFKNDANNEILSAKTKEAQDATKRLTELNMEEVHKVWHGYVNGVARAAQAWQENNPVLTRQLLLSQRPWADEFDNRGFEWFYLWRQLRGATAPLAGHTAAVTAVAISENGELAISSDASGALHVWDLKKGQIVATLRGHANAIHAAVLSPDGKTLASAGADKTICLWDVPAVTDPFKDVTKPRLSWPAHESAVLCLAFGKDGKTLVSGGTDHAVVLWNAEDGKELSRNKPAESPVTAVAFAPSGTSLACSTADGGIYILDPEKGTTITAIMASSRVNRIAFSPDGSTIVSVGASLVQESENGSAIAWDAATGKEKTKVAYSGPALLDVAFIDADQLAFAGKDGMIHTWKISTNSETHSYKGHLGWVSAVAFNTPTRTLITGSFDTTVRQWRLGAYPAEWQAHTSPVLALEFAPGDHVIASASRDGEVKFWNPDDGAQVGTLTGLKAPVTSLAFTRSRDPIKLATGTYSDKNEGEVKIWEVAPDKQNVQAKELFTLKDHTGGVTCVAFSPDNATLASGSADATAILWDVATGTAKFVLKGHTGAVRGLTFSYDGKSLLTAGADGKVFWWDTASGKQSRAPLDAHPTGVNAIVMPLPLAKEKSAFDFVVTAGNDGTTKLWLWSEKGPTLFPNNGAWRSASLPATSLAHARSNDFLISGSWDHTVRIVDLHLASEHRLVGLERFTFAPLGAPVRSVAVSGDNLTVIAAGDDGVLHCYRSLPARVVDPLQPAPKKE